MPEPIVRPGEGTQAVVCHAGSRDHYQVAWALSEVGRLLKLVTDFYFDPGGFGMPRGALRAFPKLGARSCPALRPAQVLTPGGHVLASLIQRCCPSRERQIALDRRIGATARREAARSGSALVSYSYYAGAAFSRGPDRPVHRILFQLHPHPAAVRRLLQEELERVPQAAESLRYEHEVGSTEEHFQGLCEEPKLATAWLAASRYTARTLVEHGVPEAEIRVIPYGVDLGAFPTRTHPPERSGPLRLIGVGSVIQRKGLSYLLEAIRRLGPQTVELVLCTQTVVDEALLRSYGLANVRVLRGLTRPAVVEELHRAEVFVLPSLTEGFGLVLLEAMATGLPVLTTPNTSGPDLLVEGETGFIVPIRDAGALAERLAWAGGHRDRLFEMGQEAARAARGYSWSRFRAAVAQAYRAVVDGPRVESRSP